MSLLPNRRALVLTGLTGLLLTGATLATTTAAHADDGSPSDTTKTTTADDTITDFPVTITDAADAAESKYPDCETTAALLYDTASTPVWDVELTCDSGTIKYVTVNAEDGKVTDDGTRTDDTSGSTADDDDWWSTTDDDKNSTTNDKSSGDDKPTTKDKPSNRDDKPSDTGDAPGTGANTDYS